MPAEESAEMPGWREWRVVFADNSCDPSTEQRVAANP